MNSNMMAYCGTYCEMCDWKEGTNCKGCKLQAGTMFWGNCAIAQCAIDKKLAHCGECVKLPCQMLQDAFNHPEHGDTGERLKNLLNWKNGRESTLKINGK
jgi:hypothetical protein